MNVIILAAVLGDRSVYDLRAGRTGGEMWDEGSDRTAAGLFRPVATDQQMLGISGIYAGRRGRSYPEDLQRTIPAGNRHKRPDAVQAAEPARLVRDVRNEHHCHVPEKSMRCPGDPAAGRRQAEDPGREIKKPCFLRRWRKQGVLLYEVKLLRRHPGNPRMNRNHPDPAAQT